MATRTVQPTPAWKVGALLVLAGVLLLLDTTGLFPLELTAIVPAVMVGFGVYVLFARGFTRVFWPLVLVTVGLGWQLVALGVTTEARIWDYWPVFLIVLGVSVLIRRRQQVYRVDDVWFTNHGIAFEDLDTREVVAVFNDASVDLREAEAPVAVECVAVFGDVTVFVPEDWTVATTAIEVVGDVEDLRLDHPAADPDVVIDGLTVFGDVLVR
ncbi:LiaF transmembrane domain-containing protein [Haloarchaeobius sp. TZWSO28]|uniref:LiaF transmembrane domain-containing protein n=1 Tax=Haloarchaeobius sp. TZWSO28 TaxID=3446119 RepID=UPI003EBF7972